MSYIGDSFKYLRTLLAFVLLPTVSAPAVAGGCEAGGDAQALALPGYWRGFGVDGEAQWLRFAFDSPAVVTLDVTVPLTASGEAVLTVFGPSCRTRDDGFLYLERTPAHQVLVVNEPGEYLIRLGAEDPSRPLLSYKVAAALDEKLLTKDTEEIEIDPDGLRADGRGGPCAEAADDHADTVSCATPLTPGTLVAGKIGNAWGDDADLFRFSLTEPRIVRIEARGETDTVGGLFNRDGHRLVVDDDGGGAAGFLIVKALVPGDYVLRVEGREVAEQPYSLSLESRPW